MTDDLPKARKPAPRGLCAVASACAALMTIGLAACGGGAEADRETAPPARSLAAPYERVEGAGEAPFATAATAAIMNYSRNAPYVATAGAPGPGGVRAAKEAGFGLLIDLRQPDEEGVAGDIVAAREAGMDRISLPMPQDAAAMPAFLGALTAILNDERRYPILLHCASANRAGAAWALYRAGGGIAPLSAIEEGRAAGMTSKEETVRRLLRLPGLTETK